jgi:prolipoprotein diacylglyceryltransferase
MFPRLADVPTPWGSLVVQTHGVLLALGLVLGWYLFTHPPHACSPRERGRVFLAMALGGLVGGKLVRAASTGGVFFEGGLDALGVMLGATFVLWLARRDLATLAAPIGALVAAALALGEHLGGARFGVVATEPAWLVVRHPRWADGLGSPAFREHLAMGRLEPDATASLPTLPVPLLDAALALALFVVTQRRPRRGPAIVLGLYALGRLGLDRLRHDPSIVDAVAAGALLVVAALSLRSRAQVDANAKPNAAAAPEDVSDATARP